MENNRSIVHSRRVLLIFALFVVINITVLGWFFVSHKPATLSPLMPYIPSNIQQAVLIDSKMILALAGDDLSTINNNPLYTLVSTTNHIGLLQFGTGIINQTSAILIEAQKTFSVEQFLSFINMQDDTDYVFQKISERHYLFATPMTIEQLGYSTTAKFVAGTGFSRIKPLITNKDLVFISRVDADAVVDYGLSPLLSATDIFVVTAKAQRARLAINGHLLYTQPKDDIIAHNFVPTLSRYIHDQTVAYIETNTKGLWNDQEQKGIFDSIRQTHPDLFGDINDATLQSIIESNLGLIIQNSSSFADLRIALIMDILAIYPLVRNIFPLLQDPLALLVGIDPSVLTIVDNTDRIAYQTTLFGLIPTTLQAYQQSGSTIVSIGADAKLSPYALHKPSPSPAGSIAYLFVQFDPLLQLYKQFATMAGQQVQDPFFVQQEKILKGKHWAGYIAVDPEKVSLISTIQ